MQFIVFAAFAIVLSVPEGGPPWPTVTSRAGSWVVVIGQVVLAGAVGAIWSQLVKRRLERDPAWLPGAQRRLVQGSLVLRLVLMAGLLAVAYMTDWTRMVRGWAARGSIWGLDELLILGPFFTAIVAGYAGLYAGDRAIRQVSLEQRLWAMAPARPVWSLRQYLSFNLRQHVLIIAMPMVPIVVASDFAAAYSRPIRRATGVAWADQAVLVAMAGLVFLLAPLMLRHIWHTRVLPAGELRGRLEELCGRMRLTYRRILVWESDGMVVNAAVMGLVRPVRYILLSDGLLEMMEDRQIEAVFGHEAGHVKLRHIEFYLLFAMVSMFIVGGIFELLRAVLQHWPGLFPTGEALQDYMQVGAMGLIVVVWGLGFGFVSRRFEWQADLFGARSITPPASQCSGPCLYHGTEREAESGDKAREPMGMNRRGEASAGGDVSAKGHREAASGSCERALCATAAGVFARALQRIASLNGIPMEARSWRHSSIANRVRRLQAYAVDPGLGTTLQREVGWIKVVLVLGTFIGLAVGLWLYWPAHLGGR